MLSIPFGVVVCLLFGGWVAYITTPKTYEELRYKANRKAERKANRKAFLKWCLVAFIVCLTLVVAGALAMGVDQSAGQGFLALIVAVAVVTVGLKARQLARWWYAWDDRGEPIEIEVLPPAPPI